MAAINRDEEMLRSLDRQWRSLTIADDFVFGKVMRDEDIYKAVLEAILGVPLEHVEYVGNQDQIDEAPDMRGVRLDVYVRDAAGTVYDVEMQTTNTRELPQRARYYHSMLALAQLEKGTPYRRLKDAYVIFICGFDLFGEGRRVYSFESRTPDGRLGLGDGLHTIFLAATSPTEPDTGGKVNELLDYVARGTVSGALSSRLDEAVAQVRDNRKWRLEYMIQAVKDQLNVDRGRELGFQEGHEAGVREGHEAGMREGHEAGVREGHEAGVREGHEAGVREGHEAGVREGHEAGMREGHEAGVREGQEEGERRLARLVAALLEDGRTKDVVSASSDPQVRRRLYEEYHLS